MLVLLLATTAVAHAAVAETLDWKQYAEVEVVEVLSSDEDDSTRTTKVWLAVVDGQAYIRTSNTRWGSNVVRDPEIVLRIGDDELEVQVHFIEDPPLRERVVQAFREKYGLIDKLLGFLRSANPKIMRLDSR
jgi:hypothetical protein